MDSEQLEQAAEVLHDQAAKEHAAEVAAEQPTASERLRSFEDTHLGKDVVRIDGKIERGHGSMYQKLKPEQRTKHDLLTSLVEAEDRMHAASRDLHAATSAHAEALAKVS